MDSRNWWKRQDGVWLNAERDKDLKLSMRHAPQVIRRQWRGVRAAATALLRLAYGTAEDGSRLTPRDIMRDLRAVSDYSDRRWPSSMAPVGRGLFPLVELPADAESLRLIQYELRCALAILVLTADDATRRRRPWVPQSPERVSAEYYAVRPDALTMRREMVPLWLTIVYDAATVLEAAMPWFRCCALCSRLFFRIKRQRLCGDPRCESVFHAREGYERKGDETERRGRKRKDYAAVFEQAHGAWLHAAVGPPGAEERQIWGERQRRRRRRREGQQITRLRRRRA